MVGLSWTQSSKILGCLATEHSSEDFDMPSIRPMICQAAPAPSGKLFDFFEFDSSTQVSVTEWKHRGNITVIWVILWGTGRYSRKIKKAQTGAAVFRPCLAGVEEVNRISWPNQVSKISETDTASQASHMSKQLSRLHCSAFSYTSRSPGASWEFLVAVDSALHGAISALQSNIRWHKSQRMQKV